MVTEHHWQKKPRSPDTPFQNMQRKCGHLKIRLWSTNHVCRIQRIPISSTSGNRRLDRIRFVREIKFCFEHHVKDLPKTPSEFIGVLIDPARKKSVTEKTSTFRSST